MNHQIPETGFLRLWQIIGDPKRGAPPIIPVCAAAWWKGVKNGQYPAPVKLSQRCTAWRAEDIRELVKRLSKEAYQPSESRRTKGKG